MFSSTTAIMAADPFLLFLQRRRQKPQEEHLHRESHFRGVLAIYKIPAGLFRRALHRMRQRKLPEKGLNQLGFEIPAADGVEEFFPGVEGCEETEKAAKELEKEMWQKFYGTGFWRSPSQTHN
ncbi:Detected protein of unknown function [Hibiscus syriacus]|uniref:Uncharacterized protein n=1 Tax=Hibiscus syriacus TaxID=106335 RepID=A0A6A3CR66_HIBSY|nr:Detected protein of unknown function [Hibiscus syriacus]